MTWKSSNTGVLAHQKPFFEVNGVMLMKDTFSKETHKHVALIGLNPAAWSGHSYRSGCATIVAMASLSDWEIKPLDQRCTPEIYQSTDNFVKVLHSKVSGTPFSFRNAYITNVI